MPPPEHGVDARFEQLTARLTVIALLAVAAASLLPWFVLPAAGTFYLIVFGSLVAWTLLVYGTIAPRWPSMAAHVAFLITPALLTWAALRSGGSLSPAFTTYSLVFISGASVLFPARYAWASLLFVGGLGAWLAHAEAQGLLPAPWVEHTTTSRWLAVIGGGIVLFFVQQLETHWLRSALQAAKREVRQREETERGARLQQARFEELVSMVPGAMYEFEIDRDGRRRFTFISPGVQALVGVTPETLLRDADSLFALVPADERGPLEASIADSHVRLVPWRYEGTIVAVNGDRKWLEGRAVPRRLADGTVRWYGVFSDQSERRLLEQQLVQAQKLEALGTLAGGIAHDFNNLLTVILGQAELARLLAEGQGEVTAALDEVSGAGTRASELVRQILDFSQPRAPERSRVELGGIVDAAIKLLRPSLPASVAIETRVADEAWVLGNPSQIHQVITNLAVNAGHAMGGANGRLEVSLDVVVPGLGDGAELAGLHRQPHARLRVRDTGHGMTPDTLQRIFEPFFTTKTRGEGSGLGLAVVHGIVTRHEGAITVESRPGAGTAFDVYLPILEGPAMEGTPAAEPERGLAAGRGERVLIVDDEAAIVRLATTALERQGYSVTGFTDAREALARFAATPEAFDVVLTDLTMPALSGLDVAQAVRARRPDLPVVLCSGFRDEWSRERIAHAAVREFLPKPLTPRSLGGAIRRALSGRHDAAPPPS